MIMDGKRFGYARVLQRSVMAMFILMLLLPCDAPADDWGIVKRADTLVNVRAKRSGKSRITCRLKPGYRVKVDFLEGSWWAVFRVSETRRSEEHALGYVYAPCLRPLNDSSMTIPGDYKEKVPSR